MRDLPVNFPMILPLPDPTAFHAHLDACWQCRDHPMGLCVEGARLLQEAVARPQATGRAPAP